MDRDTSGVGIWCWCKSKKVFDTLCKVREVAYRSDTPGNIVGKEAWRYFAFALQDNRPVSRVNLESELVLDEKRHRID